MYLCQQHQECEPFQFLFGRYVKEHLATIWSTYDTSKGTLPLKTQGFSGLLFGAYGLAQLWY